MRKDDNHLDLSIPMEYVNYKILLAWKDDICPSEDELQSNPKHTYQFVITNDNEELTNSVKDLSSKTQAYRIFGNIENDFEKLAYLCEKIAGKTIHKSNKDLILDSINKAILNQTQKFIIESSNKYLDTEILLKKAVDRGFVSKYKNEYLLKEGNVTLCPPGKIPTLATACEFLNLPKNQEYNLMLQAMIEE